MADDQIVGSMERHLSHTVMSVGGLPTKVLFIHSRVAARSKHDHACSVFASVQSRHSLQCSRHPAKPTEGSSWMTSLCARSITLFLKSALNIPLSPLRVHRKCVVVWLCASAASWLCSLALLRCACVTYKHTCSFVAKTDTIKQRNANVRTNRNEEHIGLTARCSPNTL